jgi:hypothetical protein
MSGFSEEITIDGFAKIQTITMDREFFFTTRSLRSLETRRTQRKSNDFEFLRVLCGSVVKAFDPDRPST